MTDDQPLMRYLTHDKFIRLLNPQPAIDVWKFLDPPPKRTEFFKAPTPVEYGSIWMASPNTFSDKDEGMFPALNASDESFCEEAARHLGLSPEEATERKNQFIAKNPSAIRDGIRARTQLCGVSCWYQDSQESEKMWNEYVSDRCGVIVKTTLKEFDEALGWTTPQYNRAACPAFATINYVDRDNFFLVNDGYYHLLSIKGEGFKHEREVRLIAKSPELVRATANQANPSLEKIIALAASAGRGFNVLVDLKRLITEIRVHPQSNSDYIKLIQEEIEKKDISPEIVRPSDLAAK
ncbi:MAG: hypothetical protein KDA68_12920 [Planctomycetaceae bacterium]|nr:hypothetical protein [Planctomycetaceae bacterium]